ncbi:MAG: hypothetical protein ACK4NR_09165 [Micavibrio sp.]
MSQYDFGTIDTEETSGAELAAMLQFFRDALYSCHAGNTAPSYATKGLCWLDTTASPGHLLKMYTGSAWAIIGKLDITAGTFTPYLNGAELKSLGSADPGEGLEIVSNALRVKMDGGTLSRSASGLKVAAGGITGAQLETLAGLTAGTYNTANVTVDVKGRVTAIEEGAGGLSSVSQGDLNTSTGTLSQSITENGAYGSVIVVDSFRHDDPSDGNDSGYITRLGRLQSTVDSGWQGGTITRSLVGTLPGGSYGFYPQCRRVNGLGGSNFTFYAQQRYITASPPFDLGDGDVEGFLFLLMNRDGTVAGHYFADVPPWGYNGPTDIRAAKINRKTGKKFRRVRKPISVQAILDGADIEYQYEEITQKIKNADMELIPHPFAGIGPDQTVVLVDPMNAKIGKLLALQNLGENITKMIHDGYIFADNRPLEKRKGPCGVMQCGLRIK